MIQVVLASRREMGRGTVLGSRGHEKKKMGWWRFASHTVFHRSSLRATRGRRGVEHHGARQDGEHVVTQCVYPADVQRVCIRLCEQVSGTIGQQCVCVYQSTIAKILQRKHATMTGERARCDGIIRRHVGNSGGDGAQCISGCAVVERAVMGRQNNSALGGGYVRKGEDSECRRAT